jgi:hypothetical protein
VLRSDPSGAQEALGHVRRASRTVLDELGTVLGVLRQSDERQIDGRQIDGGPAGEFVAPAEPVPGLGRMEELVESFRATGLRVIWRRSGQTYPLPAQVDLAAYRVLQEALTNAHKHGGDSVRILLSYRPEELSIEVENEVAPARRAGRPQVGTGYGLLGMRERVSALGGTMHAGPRSGGGYQVRAVLPSGREC